MTIVSQLIVDAFRQSNLLSINASVTLNQQLEAVRLLNRIVKSVYGNEAGNKLLPVNIDETGNATYPDALPWFDPEVAGVLFVPLNVRLMLNVADELTVYLHPFPQDGSRFAVSDISGNLSTYPFTIDGNGRTIEDSSDVTMVTDNENSEWFYRQDRGNWYKLLDLTAADTFPFPEDFDDFFITLLAMRLNPAYGVTLDSQSQAVLSRSRAQFRARYKITKEQPTELGLFPRYRGLWSVASNNFGSG